MNRFFIAAFTVCTAHFVGGCATQERLELPVKLQAIQPSASSAISWLDERPASDGARSEVATAIGFLVTLGDDISYPSTIDYLRSRIQTESTLSASRSTIRIKRFKVTAESRNSWASLGFRPPSSVPVAMWEMKQMPLEYRSKVEAIILLEVDGKSVEAKSAIPFDRQASSTDIANAIKIAVENAVRALPR